MPPSPQLSQYIMARRGQPRGEPRTAATVEVQDIWRVGTATVL